MTSDLTVTETAYEIGFANGYGTEAAPDAPFGTLAELQSWERGYDAGKKALALDTAHRAWLDAQGF